MKVILFDSVENVGLPGDIAEVRAGFYRNFLGPRGIAVEASKGNIKMLELKRKGLQAKAEILRNQSKSVAEQLASVTVHFIMKVGDSNRLFGSVTNMDIADKLRELGHDIDRRRIAMPGIIKTAGAHTVKVKLEGNINVPLQVMIEAEAKPEEPAEDRYDYRDEEDDGAEAEEAAAETTEGGEA